MRPLILKFKGLRSYRAEQKIDFAHVSLMAVVGDTGAGKSSLLEAVYFALYGGSTWDARGGGKKLIADGGDGTLRVELTFRARAKNWRITRTTSVNNYPPSTHHLEGLDDNIQVDNAGPVNDAIRKLVGLDNSAFLKAVILPQGRFQELLQTREADRTTIFRNVLGLDQITEVRRQATALHDRLNPHLEAMRRRRAGLLPNPSQAISDATRRLYAAQKQAAKLDHIKNVVSEAQEVYDEAASRAREWRAVAQQLTAKIPDDTEGEYRRLIELEAQLANKLVTVDRQLYEAEEHEVDLKEVLDSADVDGTGVSGIASALATLQALLDQIPGLDDDQHIITNERAAIDADSATAHARKAAYTEIVNKAEHAQAKAESANATHSAATQNLERCSTMLAQARHAAEAVATASVAADTARQTAGQRTKEAAAADRAANQAEKDLAAAVHLLEVMHRANAAAHAAAASRPGEPCPICVRPLPEDFSAPTASGTEQATAAQSVAQKRAKALASKLAAATESRNTAQTDLDKALDAVAQAIADRDQALDALYTVLGHVDLDHNDEAILGRVQATVRQVAAAKETAEFEAKVAHDVQTVEATELHYAERVLADRENALAKLQQASERRKEKIAKAHGTLPIPYQLDAELTTPAIESSRRKAKQRQDELREVSLRLDTAQKQVKLLRSDKERLSQERRIVVEQPATLLSQRIQALADLSADAAQLTGLPASPARPSTLSVTKGAHWANGVLIAVGTITEHCLGEASTQDKVALIAKIDGAATLAAADIADGAALATLQIDAKADERVAARDRDDAVAQQPVCAKLDSRISATKPMVDSLRELASLLADGKFMAAVVKRRQRALLGIASELFQSMTKDRFAFSDDFRIVDGHTGQPRDVKTLSGGETFLASLSLALALVELTSRGGGRVEALFLDEGFGSLDTNALGEALEALTRQAGGDRLVAVISHMRDVAENFDNVLVVTKTVAGSQARWASPAERDQLVTDELVTGLLT